MRLLGGGGGGLRGLLVGGAPVGNGGDGGGGDRGDFSPLPAEIVGEEEEGEDSADDGGE